MMENPHLIQFDLQILISNKLQMIQRTELHKDRLDTILEPLWPQNSPHFKWIFHILNCLKITGLPLSKAQNDLLELSELL